MIPCPWISGHPTTTCARCRIRTLPCRLPLYNRLLTQVLVSIVKPTFSFYTPIFPSPSWTVIPLHTLSTRVTMPSHTVHSALLQMYWDDSGAPWKFPLWQEITGVRHGLFPADDALLPRGWTREMASLIASYFDQYKNQGSEDQKIQFSSGLRNANQVPGRALWKKWVTETWRLLKMHARITEVLVQENLHPLTIALSSRSGSLEWPKATTYVPLAINPVGRTLFGVDCLDSHSHVYDELRTTISGVIVRTWINVNNQTKRSKVRIINLEKEAIEAFESKLLSRTLFSSRYSHRFQISIPTSLPRRRLNS